MLLFDIERIVTTRFLNGLRPMPRPQMLRQVSYVRPNASSNSLLARSIPTESSANGYIFEILRVRDKFSSRETEEPHWSGGLVRDLSFKVKVGFQVPAVGAASISVFRTASTIQRCACRSRREEYRNLCQCMTSSLHTVVAAVYLLRISLGWCCRNRWGEPFVNTLVCELRINHQVSDEAASVMCDVQRCDCLLSSDAPICGT